MQFALSSSVVCYYFNCSWKLGFDLQYTTTNPTHNSNSQYTGVQTWSHFVFLSDVAAGIQASSSLNAELDRCNIDDRIWGDIRGMEVVKCQLTLPAFFDLISPHILIKMKENNWSGEYMYIVLSFLTKSVKKNMVSDCQLSGELAIKGGLFTVVSQKEKPI